MRGGDVSCFYVRPLFSKLRPEVHFSSWRHHVSLSAQVKFFQRELQTPTWMRALSLQDPVANSSDRADHGPLGAYDGWPARASVAMAELGYLDDAVTFLQSAATVLSEGPFGQAHRLFSNPIMTPNSTQPIALKSGMNGGQDYNENVAGSFADAALHLLAIATVS